MKEHAKGDGMPTDELSDLKDTVWKHLNIFRVSFSAGPAAKVRSMRIELAPNAKPMRVCLRK